MVNVESAAVAAADGEDESSPRAEVDGEGVGDGRTEGTIVMSPAEDDDEDNEPLPEPLPRAFVDELMTVATRTTSAERSGEDEQRTSGGLQRLTAAWRWTRLVTFWCC